MKYIFGLIAIYALLSCNKFNRDKVLYSVDSNIDNTSWVLDSIDSFDIEDVLRLDFVDTFISENKKSYKYYRLKVYKPNDVIRTSIVMDGLYIDQSRDYVTLGDVQSIKDNSNIIIDLDHRHTYTIISEKPEQGEIDFKWLIDNKTYRHAHSISQLSDIDEFLRGQPHQEISEQVVNPLSEAILAIFMNKKSNYLLNGNKLTLISEDKKQKIIWREIGIRSY